MAVWKGWGGGMWWLGRLEENGRVIIGDGFRIVDGCYVTTG